MMQQGLFPGTTGGADISSCGRYRYRLWRTWDVLLPQLVWCMLNPSTADAETDDPTLRRCTGYAKDWGYGGVEVVNLFALRATDPRQLLKSSDPVGPRNVDVITDATCGRRVVCAWGDGAEWLPPEVSQVSRETLRAGARELLCLGTTGRGNPRHPLYLSKHLEPAVFRMKGGCAA